MVVLPSRLVPVEALGDDHVSVACCPAGVSVLLNEMEIAGEITGTEELAAVDAGVLNHISSSAGYGIRKTR
jgi:hypothetical protein